MELKADLINTLQLARQHRKAGRCLEALNSYSTALEIGLHLGINKSEEVLRFMLDEGMYTEASNLFNHPSHVIKNNMVRSAFAAEIALANGDEIRAKEICSSVLKDVPATMPLFRQVLKFSTKLKIDAEPRVLLLASQLKGMPAKTVIPFVNTLIECGHTEFVERILNDISLQADNEEVTAEGVPMSIHAAKVRYLRAIGENKRAKELATRGVPAVEKLNWVRKPPHDWLMRTAIANREAVPKIVHQVWIGPLPPPVTTDMWQRHCHRHGYQYRLWRENDLLELGIDKIGHYSRLLEKRVFAGAVDIARYLILREYGGIYADADFFPCNLNQPLHNLLPMIGAFALSESTYRNFGGSPWFVTNSFLAAPPRHPIFIDAIDLLDRAFDVLPHATEWWVPGPGYLTCLTARGGIHILSNHIVASIGKVKDQEEAISYAAHPRFSGCVLVAWKPWR